MGWIDKVTHLSLPTVWEIQFKHSTAIDDDLKWKITSISKTNTWHKEIKTVSAHYLATKVELYQWQMDVLSKHTRYSINLHIFNAIRDSCWKSPIQFCEYLFQVTYKTTL